MNQFRLRAVVIEKAVLRYTPAGVPIVSAVLQHSSQQLEANGQRLIEFEVNALAAGEISGRLNELELGVETEFSGFLARKNRNSKSLVFHLTEIETIT